MWRQPEKVQGSVTAVRYLLVADRTQIILSGLTVSYRLVKKHWCYYVMFYSTSRDNPVYMIILLEFVFLCSKGFCYKGVVITE